MITRTMNDGEEAENSQKPGETLQCYLCFYLEDNLDPGTPCTKRGHQSNLVLWGTF